MDQDFQAFSNHLAKKQKQEEIAIVTFQEKILALVDRINAEKTAVKKLPLAEELRRLLKEEKANLERDAYAVNR